MRAVPCMLVALWCSYAQAESAVVDVPPLQIEGVEVNTQVTLAVAGAATPTQNAGWRGIRTDTGTRAQYEAWTQNFDPPWVGVVGRFMLNGYALSANDESASVLIEADIESRDNPLLVSWVFFGPGTASLTGTSVTGVTVDIQQTSTDVMESMTHPPFDNCLSRASLDPAACIYIPIPPGTYRLSLSQELPSIHAGDTSASAQILVIPEPSTWLVAIAAAVVMGAWHLRRKSR